jgi:plastocyanin
VTHARLTILVLAGAAALAAAPAQAGPPSLLRPPQKKTVKVYDNYYGPAKLTVNYGSTIRWVWTQDTSDIHDVKLVSAPKGVRRFQSEAGGAGYVFKRTLRAAGTYRLLCTFHEADGMKMTVVVRKRR